jgi:hypothetical protein
MQRNLRMPTELSPKNWTLTFGAQFILDIGLFYCPKYKIQAVHFVRNN